MVEQGVGEDSGQSGECIVGTDSETRDHAISEDENGSDGLNVFTNLSSNIFLVELVLLDTASVGQPRGIEDAHLGEKLRILITLKTPALTTMPFLLLIS